MVNLVLYECLSVMLVILDLRVAKNRNIHFSWFRVPILVSSINGDFDEMLSLSFPT
jgi:hypothetical protein